MKKYPISKYNRGVYIAGLIFMLIWAAVYVHIWHQAREETLSAGELCLQILLPLAMAITGVCLQLHLLFLDYGTGKFTLDEKGMTMYIGFKSYRLEWADCVEYDIVGVSVERLGPYNAANTFWIYCATRPLTYDEKRRFLRKTRYRLDMVHFFQYSPEPFELLLSYIPPDKADYLRQRAGLIKMNFLERMYNK